MTFTSTAFLIFSCVFFPLYFLTIDSLRLNNLVLVAGGFVFYGWYSPYFVILMLVTAVTDFTLGLLIAGSPSDNSRRRLLILSISVNLGFLGYFKYFNFFADTFSSVLSLARPFDLFVDVILPAGISFYTFQSMSYTIDVYFRRMEARTSLLDFLGFITFFPHLVAGPIMRAIALLPQVEKPRHFDLATAEDGARQILWGFAKKIVVADNLARAVDLAYSQPDTSSGTTLAIGTLFFAFQIYADFSAYSDIAVGLAKILGFKLIQNFRYPYFSPNIVEFWRRWHISLTTWFRDYVFFPLGGSRVPTPRWILNIVIVFLLSGLWHGANLTFLVWGAIHALLYCATMLLHGRQPIPPPRSNFSYVASVAVTFFFICIAWVFFRAQSVHDAITILTTLADVKAWHVQSEFISRGLISRGSAAILAMLVIEWLGRNHEYPLQIAQWPAYQRRATYLAVVLTIAFFGAEDEGNFIYFQF